MISREPCCLQEHVDLHQGPDREVVAYGQHHLVSLRLGLMQYASIGGSWVGVFGISLLQTWDVNTASRLPQVVQAAEVVFFHIAWAGEAFITVAE